MFVFGGIEIAPEFIGGGPQHRFETEMCVVAVPLALAALLDSPFTNKILPFPRLIADKPENSGRGWEGKAKRPGNQRAEEERREPLHISHF